MDNPISQQPTMMKPCFNFLDTWPVSNEPVCSSLRLASEITNMGKTRSYVLGDYSRLHNGKG